MNLLTYGNITKVINDVSAILGIVLIITSIFIIYIAFKDMRARDKPEAVG